MLMIISKDVAWRKINHKKDERQDKNCQEIEEYIGGKKCTEAWIFIKRIRKTGTEKVPIENIQQEMYQLL